MRPDALVVLVALFVCPAVGFRLHHPLHHEGLFDMIKIVTLLWDPNENSKGFSRMYDETWVEKLYRGFKRNLNQEFMFICFTDRPRTFEQDGIRTAPIHAGVPDYSSCIEPFRLNEPMILVGLDTVITGNVDHLAAWCLEDRDHIGLPRDPYNPHQACNGVTLCPAGMAHIAQGHRGENDMEWVRRWPHVILDDQPEFTGQIVSYKGHVERNGLGDARIVYFHGQRKPHELDKPWIANHWR